MTYQKKVFLRFVIFMFIVSIFCIKLLPYLKFNGSETAFDQGEQENRCEMKRLISTGAGYFLRSQSDFLLFLDKIEMSDPEGINYIELQSLVQGSIDNLENAKQEYNCLKDIAASTPYQPDMIEKLKTFDYNAFIKEKGLNAVIFKDLETYLKKGDIRGMYSRECVEISKILALLEKVKILTDAGQFPDLEDLWRLNQAYSQSLLFGQYAAEVFARINI
ncbi:MAG: hypothetical protein JSV88_14150 [Candidatus Aminicenantes bacterium]|nr:MAG: hypothetical protein JSV88_14150 [Candidatus Aminicenantes bacterium]